MGEPLGFYGYYVFVWICEGIDKVDFFVAGSSSIFNIAEEEFKKYLESHPKARKIRPLMIHVSLLQRYKDNWNCFS